MTDADESSFRQNAETNTLKACAPRILAFAALAFLACSATSRAAQEADTFSPVVSYQYHDSLADPATETTIMSPVVSYQYFDWPGDENLTFTNSLNVSYRYDGPPSIITQPAAQLVKAGQTVTLSVAAHGTPPLTYQWRLNGVALSNTDSPAIQIPNAQTANSGSYSVVVSNAYAPPAVSTDAKVTIYLPAPGPTPSPPALQPATQPLPPALSQKPRAPTSAQMQIVNFNRTIDPSKPTVVLTHGWQFISSPPATWPLAMGQALRAKYDTQVNIVIWDWEENARATSPATAAARTIDEGTVLGRTLLDTLGPGYQRPIHFIGHSLGTLVNCAAADYIHGDKRPKGDARAATQKYAAANTHMTLLDEAELVTAVKGLHVSIDVLRAAVGDYSGLADAGRNVRNFWSKVLPDQALWADNYVSEVGVLHSAATNVMLWRATSSRPPTAAHGYAYYWYQETVANPLGGFMGHRWSFERNSLGGRPSEGSYYLQELGANAAELSVNEISGNSANLLRGLHVVAYPNLQAFKGLSAIGNGIQGAYLNGIQYAGNMVANFAEVFSVPNGQPVIMGSAGSTPTYYVSSGNSGLNSLEANWDFQFSIQPGAPEPQNNRSGIQALAVTNAESPNAVYTIIPVQVPAEAVGISFEYSVDGGANDDFMTMGIGETNYYTVQAQHLEDAEWNGTPVIEISALRGQNVQLIFALNGETAPPAGMLSIRNIQFFVPPRPQLELAVIGHQINAAWPLSAIDWTLEANDDLSNPNGWVPVNVVPAEEDYFRSVSLDITGEKKFFFRLRK